MKHEERMSEQRRRMAAVGIRETPEVIDLLDRIAKLEQDKRDGGNNIGGGGMAAADKLTCMRHGISKLLSCDWGAGDDLLKVNALECEEVRKAIAQARLN